MMVTLSAEALGEAREAAAWYEERRRGLGRAFLDELDRTLARIEVLPRSFSPVVGPRPALGIRRALLHRFPYGVVFIERDDHLRVIAVAHAKRRRDYWLRRVED